MRDPKQADTVVGWNPQTDQIFSNGKTFSGSNMTVMDSYDKAGYFDVDNSQQLPQGFQPVRAKDVRAWMQQEGQNRGFWSAAGETTKQVLAGVPDVANMGVQAGAMTAPAGSWLEGQLGGAAKQYEQGTEGRTPDVYGRGEVASALITGGRSLAPSAAAGAASVVAPVAGTAGAGYLMGASQAWDTYQRGLAAGLTPEAAKEAALKTGSIEGIGESLADAAAARILPGAGRVVSALTGAPKGYGKRVAIDLLANAGVQAGTEYGQNYLEAQVEKDAGIRPNVDPHAEGMEGFASGLGISALMAPFGIGAAVSNRPRPQIAPVAPVAPTPAQAPEMVGPAPALVGPQQQAPVDYTTQVDSLLNTVNPAALASKKARAFAEKFVQTGWATDPAAEAVREAMSNNKWKLAEAKLRILEQGVADGTITPAGAVAAGTAGQPSADTTGAGPAGERNPADAAGGVVPNFAGTELGDGAGVPVGTGAPQRGPALTGQLAPENFTLTRTSGAPSMNFLQQQETEAAAPAQTDNTSVASMRETGQQPLFVTRGAPAAQKSKTEAVLARRSTAVQRQWDKVATKQGLPLWAGLSAEVQQQATDLFKKGQLTPKGMSALKSAFEVQAAAANREDQNNEFISGVDTVPALHVWNTVFGEGQGAFMERLARGESFASVGKSAGVTADAIRKTVGRLSTEAVAKAAADQLSPEDAAALVKAVEYVKQPAAKRRFEAAAAQVGGVEHEFVSPEQAQDLLTQSSGVRVQSAGNMGVKESTGKKAEGGIDRTEMALLAKAAELEKKMKALLAEGKKAEALAVRKEMEAVAEQMYGRRSKMSETSAEEDFTESDVERGAGADLSETQDAMETDTADYTSGEGLRDYFDIRSGQMVDEAPRVPVVRARAAIDRALRSWENGGTEAELASDMRMLALRLEQQSAMREGKAVATERTRGAQWVREKLLQAVRRGQIDAYTQDFADWVLRENPQFAHELGISIRGSEDAGAGRYTALSRVMTLFAANANDGTAVHEILHHTERMMPADVRAGVRAAWSKAVSKTMASASPKVTAALHDLLLSGYDRNAAQRARKAFGDGTLDYDTHYQLANPSEYWAVNGTRVLQGQYEANTWMAKAQQWVKKMLAKVKSTLGLDSDAPVYNALQAIIESDGRYQPGARMLGEGTEFSDIPSGRNSITAKLPVPLQEAPRNIGDTMRAWGQNALNAAAFTEDLIARAVNKGIKSAAAYERANKLRATKAGERIRAAEKILEPFNDLPSAEQKKSNDYIYSSTREGKWGFQPTWTKTVDVDATMEEQFKKLSPDAQKFVKSVFKHGYDTLEAKKGLVKKAVADEYDADIAKAEKDGNTKLAAKLKSTKQSVLDRFHTLLRVSQGSPYAPLRRTGDWVVAARSPEYIKAEEAGDLARLRELETDPNHYLVTFAETESEARALARKLNDSGYVADHRQKDAMVEQLYGGKGMMGALLKVKSQVESMAEDASEDEKKSLSKLQRVVTHLYLNSLSDASARKAEMHRKGIAGDIDMVKSFATQARSDAQFMASVEYNKQTLDAVKAMRKEAFYGDNTAEKSKVYNEIMKRYVGALDDNQSKFADRVTRATSVWMLVTSPAYHFYNLTQPFVMSLPYMAKVHPYVKSAEAISKAWAEVAGMVKDVNWKHSLDFSAIKDGGERAAMESLARLGVIDIGMSSELGSFQVEDKGKFTKAWNKADDTMRVVAQKVETINRLSTALAAYRLELARTGSAAAAEAYAGKVVTQTHGDYSRANAPRAFNSTFGRIALQFRKFQLIQLTMVGKMLRDIYAGATPDEKLAAARAFGYLAAHMAVLGGMTALPGYAVWGAVAAMLLGGEGPDDLEQKIRRAVGDKYIADLLTRGVPAVGGIDASGKIGFGNMLSVLPFTDIDPTSRKSLTEVGYALTTGAAGGLALRGGDALKYMVAGDYYRGVEQLMPSGIMNALRGYRLATQGATNSKGDVLVRGDDFGAARGMATALGFSPTETTRRQAVSSAHYAEDTYFRERTTALKERYTRAVRGGDSVRGILTDWQNMQAAQRAHGLAVTPIGELYRAPAQQRKRETNTAGGVQFTRRNRESVQQDAQ